MIKKKQKEDDVAVEVKSRGKHENNLKKPPNFFYISGKLTTYLELIKDKKDMKEFKNQFNQNVISQAFELVN